MVIQVDIQVPEELKQASRAGRHLAQLNKRAGSQAVWILHIGRVADVARAREQRSPKGQGLLRKEGPPTYAILSQN